MAFIKYRYSDDPRIFICPLNYLGSKKLLEGETYWLPEKYSIVHDQYVVYYHDHPNKDFVWKDDMTSKQARYLLECKKIQKKTIKGLNKTELIKSGILPEIHPSKDDKGILEEFKKKPIEFWRFRKRWARDFEECSDWSEDVEVLVIEFVVKRANPILPEYDWSVREKLIESEYSKQAFHASTKEGVTRKRKRSRKKKKNINNKKK